MTKLWSPYLWLTKEVRGMFLHQNLASLGSAQMIPVRERESWKGAALALCVIKEKPEGKKNFIFVQIYWPLGHRTQST